MFFPFAHHMFRHFSCIRTFNSLYYDIDLVGAFLCVSFSISFFR